MKNLIKSDIVRNAAIIGLALGSAAASFGQGESATASMTATGSGPYTYTITLDNTSSGDTATPIGTFWYSWIPFADFLPSQPTVGVNPTGWTDSVLHGAPGYSIQWTATGAGLAAGSSMMFHFNSSDSPATLAGSNGGNPIGDSYLYSGGAFSDSGTEIQVVSIVPEPSSLNLLMSGATGLFWFSRKMRRR